MGFAFEDEQQRFSAGYVDDIDAIVMEVRCTCPVWGLMPSTSGPYILKNGQTHQVFREKAHITRSSQYAGIDVAAEKQKLIEALFCSVKMHRAHSDVAVGPIEDMEIVEGEKFTKITNASANQMYNQVMGV